MRIPSPAVFCLYAPATFIGQLTRPLGVVEARHDLTLHAPKGALA